MIYTMQLNKLNEITRSNVLSQDKHINKTTYQNMSFEGKIPQKEICELSDTFLKKSENIDSEMSFFQMAEEFFKTHLLNLIKDTSEKKALCGDLLRLFRHELMNNVMSKFELNLNPCFKDFIEEENKNKKDFSYFKHQKKIFKEIITTIKDMVSLWSKIEHWKFNKNQKVTFDEMLSILEKTIKYGNYGNASIEIKNDLDSANLVIENAFEQYNLLSQIILNSLKYSEGKPITVQFTKLPEHKILGEDVYAIIAENHDTLPIKNEDIDKILKGYGHRSNDRNLKGTGLGYIEIINILKQHYPNEQNFNIIEKGRKSGVKVSVPFNLKKDTKGN